VTSQRAIKPLFRREAIEFQQTQRQWGEVVLLQPISTRLLTWFLVTSVAAIIVLLAFVEYAQKDTAVGYLSPSAGTAQVSAPLQGVIREIFVKQDEEVTQGQPLFRVTTDQLTGGGDDVNQVTLGILTSQKARLSQQVAAEQKRLDSEQQRLNASLGSLSNEMILLDSQIAMQNRRITVGHALVNVATALAAKGLLSETERGHREQALLDDTQRLASIAQQQISLRSKMDETKSSLDQLPTVTATQLQPMQGELSSVEQRIAEIKGRQGYLVRAPIPGRISLVQVNVGQLVDPHRMSMEIVPSNANLQAVLFIPARAAGLIEVGQRVRLLYDAFPYQKYGTSGGRIIAVSHTALTSADLSGPISLKEPAYKVLVALDETAIKTRDKRTITLQPDTLLHADIILERRTIMSWILQPLLSART
jgi:membrane fusion protein